eukprot:gene18019-25180_t
MAAPAAGWAGKLPELRWWRISPAPRFDDLVMTNTQCEAKFGQANFNAKWDDAAPATNFERVCWMLQMPKGFHVQCKEHVEGLKRKYEAAFQVLAQAVEHDDGWRSGMLDGMKTAE